MHSASKLAPTNTHSLHPKIKLFLDQYNAIASTLGMQSIEQLRASFESFALIQGGVAPRLARIEDSTIPNNDNTFEIPIRIYTPTLNKQLPALLYFHGGGWQRGSLDSHDVICRYLAIKSGCAVISVEWRLAPEHKFPIGFHDVYDAYNWLLNEGFAKYNIDRDRIAIGGDSAGGNLSAALCLKLRENSEKMPAFQLLLYPSLDLTCSGESYKRYALGYILTTERVKELVSTYIDGDVSKLSNPFVSPLQSKNMEGLPPTHVVTAEFDPLCDEGLFYAEQLKLAGTQATHQSCEGMIHGFLHMIGAIPEIEKIYEDIGKILIENLKP
jgi:acetyl esterase